MVTPRKSRHMRVSVDFIRMRDLIKKETGQEFTDPEFTRGITEFLDRERLLPIMARRVKKRKKRGIFS